MLSDKHGIRQYQFSATFIFFYTTAEWKEMSGFAYIAAAPRWWLCYHPASVRELAATDCLLLHSSTGREQWITEFLE